MWEHFDHQADIGIRGFGATKEAAFEQAALSLTAVIVSVDAVEPLREIVIKCNASDDEILLVDWLNCLLYEMDTRKMLFSRFEVDIKGECLVAKAWGEEVDVSRHRPAVEVKAATFTEVAVREEKKGKWAAQCVVDV